MSRDHHYIFGHVALRQIFNENPHGFVGALLSEGKNILNEIWNDIGKNLEKEGEQSLSSEGLDLVTTKLNDELAAVIIILPEPEEIAEARFVALIVGVPRKRFWGLLGTARGITRYITLEHGMNIESDVVRTVMCEWEGESHLNMGDGPAPTTEAFIAELAKIV